LPKQASQDIDNIGRKGWERHLCARIEVAEERFNWLLAMIRDLLLKLSIRHRKHK